MTLAQVLLLYLMAGGGVAVAVYLSVAGAGFLQRWFQIVSAALFWPLYLPLLLSSGADRHEADKGEGQSITTSPPDELSQAIAQVDAELAGALRSLDGWAEDVLAREKDRLHELRSAWGAQARRIWEMDRLLGRAECPPLVASFAADAFSDRMRTSQQVICQNRNLLHEVRERTFQDLVGTLAWVRELVSMIHLAKFTGAPASRAEELVAQIAAAVEGLSEMTWQEAIPGTQPAVFN